jgi:uncharacterized protein with NRDE domain
MCLLAVFFRVVEDAPLVAGANREEAYARGGDPPLLQEGSTSHYVGGRDPAGGGTWFAVNEHGVLVAVTNRIKSQPPSAPRSRGLLVRDLLGATNAAAAAVIATKELGTKHYAGCNLLVADSRDAIVLHAGDWLRVRPLPPGLHVLTAHDVNDASDRRLGHALWWLSQRHYAIADDCVTALQQVCAQAGNGDPPICLHGPIGGTVSSSIVALRAPLTKSSFWHAQGPPDRTSFTDCSELLRQLFPKKP